MKRYSKSDLINRLCHKVVKGGYRIDPGTEHPRVIAPDGRFVVAIPKTPSDCRGELNWRSRFRRRLREMNLEVIV